MRRPKLEGLCGLLTLPMMAASSAGPAHAGDAELRSRTGLSPTSAVTAITDQVIVQFHPGAGQDLAERAIREAGAAWARRSAFENRYLLTVDAGLDIDGCLDRLRSMPEVDYAEANGRVRAHRRPNDRRDDGCALATSDRKRAAAASTVDRRCRRRSSDPSETDSGRNPSAASDR